MNSPANLREVAQAGKDRDPAWYRVHRRLSIHITAMLLRTTVKLDHITYAMMVLGVLAAVLVASTSLWANALGVLAGYGSFLLDKVDGEIARVRREQAVRGILLDRIHHRFVEPLLFLALGLRAWQATDSWIPVIAALATMLAANIIEEMQMLPPFIAAKHARETRSWPVARRLPSAAVERLAAVMRSLKTFRMYLTVLPLVLLAILAEAWTGRSVTTGYLIASAAALWVYALFQAWYYLNGQLDADIAALTRQLPPLPEADVAPAESRLPFPGAVTKPAEKSRRVHTRGAAGIVVLTFALAAGPAGAATFYVDISNPSATAAGPGTSLQPYNSISAAVAARAAAGNIILVRPGTYREQVTIPASGIASAPFVLRATASGVIVDGADNFSLRSRWAANAGTAFLATSVTWAPKQVIVDGVRLTATSSSILNMPLNSYRHIASQGLYVNLGGTNPGDHQTFVGRRSSAFVASGKSWFTIEGFDIRRADDRAINLSSAGADIELVDNQVSWSLKYGIYVSECARVRIANNRAFDNGHHGIMLTTGTTQCVVEDNESYRNAVPNMRAANGIYLYGATNNVLRRNKWHDNQDTGAHLQSGSNNNICYNNLSWNNGDHGYDHLGAVGTMHINDVSYGNFKDGFSIEGGSTNTRLHNCISVNNGLTQASSDLWVDAASLAGFESNDNIFWNSTSTPPIKIASSTYSNIAQYIAVTGQDTRSLQADPKFVSAAGGDFRLQSSSPAIDNGNASVPNWPSRDRDDRQRRDTPGIANSGLGSPNYSDRGAHEFQPSGQAPVANLTATPSSGNAPLAVNLSAAGSSDQGGSVVSYFFNFGDGSTQGPQSGNSASHVYQAGTFQASVTVTDNSGLTNTKTVTINAAGTVVRPPVVTAPAAAQTHETVPLTVNVTASDPDGDAITSLTADLTGLPNGHTAVFTPGPGNTSGTLSWTPSYASSGTFTIRFIAANALADTTTTVLTVLDTDRAPVVIAPATATFYVGSQGTVNVTANDPEGHAIASLTADLQALPTGHTAAFTPGAGNTTGALSWTPTSSQLGTFSVTFTGSNALTGRDTTVITVLPANRPPVAVMSATPTSGQSPLPVTFNGSASSDPDGGALSYRFDFGDGVVLGPQASAMASHEYGAGTYTAILTVTDLAGTSDTASAVITVTATGVGPNLVANPSFETNLAGWGAYSGASLLRVAGGHDGGWAVQVTNTSSPQASYGINDSPNWVANAGNVGSRYRFSAWVRSASALGSAKLQVREYLGSTKIGATTISTPVTLSPQWQLISVEHVTGAPGSTLDFQVYETPVALGEVFLVDDVAIRLLSGGGQTTVAANESESHVALEPSLTFGARIVPSVMQSNATLHFTTTVRGPVQVELFDAAGRRVRTLVDEQDMAPGVHSQQFDGRSDHGERLESGVYFYRVRAAARSAVGRLVLAR